MFRLVNIYKIVSTAGYNVFRIGPINTENSFLISAQIIQWSIYAKKKKQGLFIIFILNFNKIFNFYTGNAAKFV